MQQTPTIPVPTVMIPQHLKPGTTPIVPVPTPTVTRPVVPVPVTTFPVPIPRPQTNVATPIATPTTVPIPVPRPQTTTVPLPTPQPTQVPQPQITPRPIIATPTPTPTQGQGGILRQFGGGGTTTIMTGPQVTAAPTVTIVTETGYSILVRLIGVWGGTPEQAQQLSELQYMNGTSIIDVKRRDVIMEVIGMLKNQTFDEVIDFLTDAPSVEFVMWDQEALDEGRIKVAREITIQQAEEVGVKGVGRCRYCPSTELVFAMKQLRSGDEPATIFVRCVLCNKQWRQ